MWPFDRFFARKTTEPKHSSYAMISTGRADSGVIINETAALSCSTAWACGTLISRSVAMLPKHVFAARGTEPEDGNQRLAGHPVEGLLNREPNAEVSSFSAVETLFLSAMFTGNGYAEIERDEFDRPVALWPIPSHRIEAVRDDAGTLEYDVWNGAAGKVTLPARDMFHLAGPSIAGPVGMSVLDYAKNTIGIAVAQERFAANFIRNQAAPSGMIKVKSGISKDGLTRLRSDVEAVYSGSRRAGKIIIADDDWTWQQLGVSPQDAEFLAQRKFSVEEVCRFFGVPPQMIGVQDKQTLNNYEQAALQFHQLAVLPWVVRFEQETNRKLLSVVRGRARPFLKINTVAIVRANIEAQYRAFALGRQWGWLSVNDIRRTLDMEPIGAEGDIYLQPMGMQEVPADPADPANAGAGARARVAGV